MMSSVSVTCSMGPMTEISSSSAGSSSAVTGTKRGSRKAALTALETTARRSGSRATIEPMQPRSSPARVRTMTKQPAGRSSSSSASSLASSLPSSLASSVSVTAGRRPARTLSIDCRAMARSLFRCVSLSMAVNEHQIPGVDDESGSLAEDDDRIATQQAVNRHEHPSPQRQPPEAHRDMALAPALRRNPLNNEPRRKNRLADESEQRDQIPLPGGGVGGRVEKWEIRPG